MVSSRALRASSASSPDGGAGVPRGQECERSKGGDRADGSHEALLKRNRVEVTDTRMPMADRARRGARVSAGRDPGSDQERVLEQDERRAFARGTVSLDGAVEAMGRGREQRRRIDDGGENGGRREIAGRGSGDVRRRPIAVRAHAIAAILGLDRRSGGLLPSPAARSSRPSAGGRRSDSGASSAPADTRAAEGPAPAPPASAIGRNAAKSPPQESAIATDLSNAESRQASRRPGRSDEGGRLAGPGVLGRLHPIQRDGAAARTAKDGQELIGIDRLDQVGIEACLRGSSRSRSSP